MCSFNHPITLRMIRCCSQSGKKPYDLGQLLKQFALKLASSVSYNMQWNSKSRYPGIDKYFCYRLRSYFDHWLYFDPASCTINTGQQIFVWTDSFRVRGNGPTISICTVWKRADGKSNSWTADFVCLWTFDCWHATHSTQNCLTVLSKLGQKYLDLISLIDAPVPGCAKLSKTALRSSFGTNGLGYLAEVSHRTEPISRDTQYSFKLAYDFISSSPFCTWAISAK